MMFYQYYLHCLSLFGDDQIYSDLLFPFHCDVLLCASNADYIISLSFRLLVTRLAGVPLVSSIAL